MAFLIQTPISLSKQSKQAFVRGLAKMLTAWLEKIELLESTTSFQAKVSLGITMLFLATCTIVAPIRCQISPFPPLTVGILFLSYGLAITALILIWKYPDRMVGKILILASVYLHVIPAAYYNGGLAAPIIPVLVMIPTVAGFILGRRAVIHFLAVSMVTLLGIYMCWYLGLLQHSHLDSSAKLQTALLLVMVALALCSGTLSYFYEKSRAQATEEIKTLQDLFPGGFAKINSSEIICAENHNFSSFMQRSGVGHNFFTLLELILDGVSISKEDIEMASATNPLTIQTKGGRWLELEIHPTTNQKYRGIFLTDVSRTKHQAELETKLSQSNAIKTLVVTYSHHINNPLTVAIGYIDKLQHKKKYSEESAEKISQSLERISEVVHKIRKITDQGKLETEEYTKGQRMIKF